MTTEIILKDLPKISLNEWYSGKHWSKRKALKDNIKWLVYSQFKTVFPKIDKYIVSYEIVSKTRPLDADNTIGITKLLTDILFEDDKWDIITQVCLSSRKGDEDYVRVTVTTLDK